MKNLKNLILTMKIHDQIVEEEEAPKNLKIVPIEICKKSRKGPRGETEGKTVRDKEMYATDLRMILKEESLLMKAGTKGAIEEIGRVEDQRIVQTKNRNKLALKDVQEETKDVATLETLGKIRKLKKLAENVDSEGETEINGTSKVKVNLMNLGNAKEIGGDFLKIDQNPFQVAGVSTSEKQKILWSQP